MFVFVFVAHLPPSVAAADVFEEDLQDIIVMHVAHNEEVVLVKPLELDD